MTRCARPAVGEKSRACESREVRGQRDNYVRDERGSAKIIEQALNGSVVARSGMLGLLLSGWAFTAPRMGNFVHRVGFHDSARPCARSETP